MLEYISNTGLHCSSFSLHFIYTLAKQKNISKVESDIAAARVEESSSRDMLKECMDKQEKISRLLIVNEDVRRFSFMHVVFLSLSFLHACICCCLSTYQSISRNRKQLEEIKDLHARTEKNIYSSSTALQSYIRSNNLRKGNRRIFVQRVINWSYYTCTGCDLILWYFDSCVCSW